MFSKKEKVNVDEYLAYMAIIEDQLKIFVSQIRKLISVNERNEVLNSVWNNIFLISITDINEEPTREALLFNLTSQNESFDVLVKLKNLHLLIGTIVPRFVIDVFKDNFYKTMLLDMKIDKRILNSLTNEYPFIYLLPRLSFLWLQIELQ